MVRQELEEFGETLPENIDFMFQYTTTHNDGVFKLIRRK